MKFLKNFLLLFFLIIFLISCNGNKKTIVSGQGTKGDTGNQGNPGEKGEIGSEGSMGLQGPIGPQGPMPELPWLNVKDFGAVGDGVTDDTQAIQKALDSVSSSGGIVYFPIPKVRYKITLPLNIYSNTRLLGESYTWIYQATEGYIALNIPDNRENVEIAYLKITGEGSWKTDYAGRSAIKSNHLYEGSKINNNLNIHDNVIESLSTGGISGTYRRSRIYNNTIISQNGEHGIYVDGEDIWIYNNYIVGPGSNDNVGTGIKFNQVENLFIYNNIIDNWRHTNILSASQSPSNVVIMGNYLKKTLKGGGGNGISLSFGSNFIIKNNIIESSDFYGIYSKVNNVQIINNEIKNSGMRGIEIDGDNENDVSNTLIKGNTLTNNQDGGIRVFSPKNVLIIKDNFVSGEGPHIGINIEKTDIKKGIVAYNESVGYETPISISDFPQTNNISSW